MTLHRFFLPASCISTDRVLFPREISRQIERVLRLREGQQVIVLDGTGIEYVVRLTQVAVTVVGTIDQQRVNGSEPTVHLTLYMALLKAAKLELVVQKGTEIGVSRFVPVVTERAIAGEPGESRRRRWETIAREASEQCGRGRIPTISEPLRFHQAVANAMEGGTAVLLWEGEVALHLNHLQVPGAGRIGLLIGPEGGLTDGEVAEACASGVKVATLGPRILRAETAALVGAALLLQTTGDLG